MKLNLLNLEIIVYVRETDRDFAIDLPRCIEIPPSLLLLTNAKVRHHRLKKTLWFTSLASAQHFLFLLGEDYEIEDLSDVPF